MGNSNKGKALTPEIVDSIPVVPQRVEVSPWDGKLLPDLPEYLSEALELLDDDEDSPNLNRGWFRKKLSKDDKLTFLRMYAHNLCHFTKTCKEFNISPLTMHAHFRADKQLKATMGLLKLNQVTDVEHVLAKQALNPDKTADRIFYLKMNHPSYQQKQAPQVGQVNINLGDIR